MNSNRSDLLNDIKQGVIPVRIGSMTRCVNTEPADSMHKDDMANATIKQQESTIDVLKLYCKHRDK